MTEEELDEGSRFSVRPYALTGGRTRSSVHLPIEAMVRTTPDGMVAAPTQSAECRQILVMCGAPLSVAEVSAHLSMPLGVARVLVGDLAAAGHLETRASDAATSGDRPDISLLERVLDGIQAL